MTEHRLVDRFRRCELEKTAVMVVVDEDARRVVTTRPKRDRLNVRRGFGEETNFIESRQQNMTEGK